MHNNMHNPMTRSFVARAVLDGLVIGARVKIRSVNPSLDGATGIIVNDERTEEHDVIVLLDGFEQAKTMSFYYQEVTVI
jgi:hypothetical protein